MTPGRVIYTIYVMSDSYMGLDQQYELQLEVIDPLPTENVERVYDNIDKTIYEWYYEMLLLSNSCWKYSLLDLFF